MKTIADYEKIVRKALSDTGRYNKALDMQIHSLATALRTLELATYDIDGLDCTYVLECTKTGSKPVPHPAFKIQRDAQDSVTRQMKALKLTVADLDGGDENDPLIDLHKKIANADKKKKPTIIHPDIEE